MQTAITDCVSFSVFCLFLFLFCQSPLVKTTMSGQNWLLGYANLTARLCHFGEEVVSLFLCTSVTSYPTNL